MSETSRSGSPPRLRVDRANSAYYAHMPTVEEDVLASAARVLREAVDNGVEIGLSRGPLSISDLRAKYRELAARVWNETDLPGETPVEPLHGEHNGWGPRLDAGADQPGHKYTIPWLILALDVIDYLTSMMGPMDTISWEEDAS